MSKDNKKEEIITEDEHAKACSRISVVIMLGNLLISAFYMVIGWFGHSMAALAEGADSLTDAGSSLLLILGFKISARKPDSLHPNGHKRMEYIIGLLISEIMLAAAVSLLRKSIGGISNTAICHVSFCLMVTSCVAALGKILIASYINKKNKLYQSPSLSVYYKNMVDDLKGIGLVAFATIVQPYTIIPIDAIIGILLAVIIGVDGLKSFLENVSLLIGEEKDLKKESYSYADK